MPNKTYPLHIGIVAGEESGDILAAGLIRAIRERSPDVMIEGIGGQRMMDAGCFSLYPMEKLSVMGLAEIVNHLPEILSIRRDLCKRFLAEPPDVFIGVDAPDFNLGLERRLKRAGVRTIHYVSPSVWAWRRYRVRKIVSSVDCMLTLFPFEEEFYRDQDVPVRWVGHPLADLIADDVDPFQAREYLGIQHKGPLVAMLPGSRAGEVKRLARDFIGAARWCYQHNPDVQFIVPYVNNGCRVIFEKAMQAKDSDLPLTLLNRKSLEAMAAADAVLTASGTATLECMLLKRPMVVAYRLSPLTYRVARLLVKSKYYSLPNLLAARPIVTELIQGQVTPERLGRELVRLLGDRQHARELHAIFSDIHKNLRRDANRQAAETILNMVGRENIHVS